MKYTTQQLQAMSDYEVNKALAKKLLDKQGAPYNFVETKPTKLEDLRGTDLSKVVSVVCGFGFRLDYCNNPNDVMPLAFERGIKLDCVACPAGSGFVYYAKSYDGKLQSDYDSVCRAIACLILMMED